MKERQLKKRIVKNSFWSFILSSINRLGALIFTIILARFLMPEGYGIYSIVLSIAMIFYTFADLGVSQSFIRYLSYAISKNKKKIADYHKYLLKIKLILSLIVAFLLLCLSYPISYYIFKNPALLLPLLVSSFYIFILSFENFYTQVFYCLEKIKYITLKESLSQILRIVFAVFVFYFVVSSYQILGIFVGLTLTSLFLFFVVLFYIKKLLPELFIKSEVSINKKRVRRFIGWLTIASISGIFFSYIDAIMLGIFVSPEYVGYYRVVFSLVFGISGLVGFILPVLLPVFTKLNISKTEEVFNKIFRYFTIIAIPSCFGLFVLGKYFIRFLYGYAYLPASLPLYFLSFLIFPMLLVSLFLLLFSAKEKPQIFAKLILITSAINIVLNFIFIKSFLLISPLWATAGAGIATLISWFFYFFASVYVSKKQFNFLIPLKITIKPLIASIIMAGILYSSIYFIKDMNLIFGLIEVLFGATIYLVIMFLIKGIKKEDLNVIKLVYKK